MLETKTEKSSVILTSPRASALAPRRSKKHSTAPSGRATSRMVPNCGTAYMKKMTDEPGATPTNQPSEKFAYQGKHKQINPREEGIGKIES
jgi:hypothetical protein